MPNLKVAILVVSTTASKDPSADSSGASLKDIFETEGSGKWDVAETKIVGDDALDIQRTITLWTDREEAVNVIITTGGTGFAVHDVTPEVRACNWTLWSGSDRLQAVTPLLHKQAPGLVHGMLAASLAVTPCKPLVFIQRLLSADFTSCSHVQTSGWCPQQDHHHNSPRFTKGSKRKPPIGIEAASSCMSPGSRSRFEVSSCWRSQEARKGCWNQLPCS